MAAPLVKWNYYNARIPIEFAEIPIRSSKFSVFSVATVLKMVYSPHATL